MKVFFLQKDVRPSDGKIVDNIGKTRQAKVSLIYISK